jgi:hypothetical protein
MNEPIDVPATQLYCKASRSLACAFGSALYRANSPGLTIRSIVFFLQHTRREPVYVWIAFLLWSIFICSVPAVFAIEYDFLPHTSGLSITQGRPLIDYLYYEIITFTNVDYGDIIPTTAQRETSRYLHRSSWWHTWCDVCGAGSSGFDPIPNWQRSRMIERHCSRWSNGLHCEFGFVRSASTRLGIPLP